MKNWSASKLRWLLAIQCYDGGQCFGWYNGEITEILNTKTLSVLIEWDYNCIGDSDQKVTQQQLTTSNWNPDTVKKGAWGQYLTE